MAWVKYQLQIERASLAYIGSCQSDNGMSIIQSALFFHDIKKGC